MAVKYSISEHAEQRFRLRFRHIRRPIESLISSSIIFGGQRGSQYLLLNQEHKIVFPVVCCSEGHVVKTVLTLDQAKANLSLYHRFEFNEFNENDLRRRVEENRRKAASNFSPQNTQISTRACGQLEKDVINELEFQAKKYVEENGYFFPSQKEIQELRKKLGISQKILDNYVLSEIGRLIRESNFNSKPKPQEQVSPNEQIISYAKEFVETNGYFSPQGEQKKELKRKLNISNRTLNKVVMEIGRLIRERNK